ncbi:hypothetical protein NLJ89_g9664 [Agrocybe chaxingu]|uniref:Uncharacterized protein n=1 Tax=Agrocybe chaxingu TaxID=84603 RepID=A0A9W8JST9_9AGAR|nr:hypothetical protein NLJ89_g9664 [Agrocybe chaxingu]
MRYPSGTVGEAVEETRSVSPPVMDRGGRYPGGFPESFQRTFPAQEEDDAMSDGSLDMTPPYEPASSVFYTQNVALERQHNPTPPRHFSRSNVMRLENILNDVSIDYDSQTGSRSICTSPTRTEPDDLASEAVPSRSESPVETTVKKKKVKMHKCPECHKDFPRYELTDQSCRASYNR